MIMAMSPALHLKITFDPPLSGLRNQLIQRVPMGSCIKNNVYYEKPFWKDLGKNYWEKLVLYVYVVALYALLVTWWSLGLRIPAVHEQVKKKENLCFQKPSSIPLVGNYR